MKNKLTKTIIKTGKYSTNKFRIYIYLSLLLIICIGIGVFQASTNPTPKSVSPKISKQQLIKFIYTKGYQSGKKSNYGYIQQLQYIISSTTGAREGKKSILLKKHGFGFTYAKQYIPVGSFTRMGAEQSTFPQYSFTNVVKNYPEKSFNGSYSYSDYEPSISMLTLEDIQREVDYRNKYNCPYQQVCHRPEQEKKLEVFKNQKYIFDRKVTDFPGDYSYPPEQEKSAYRLMKFNNWEYLVFNQYDDALKKTTRKYITFFGDTRIETDITWDTESRPENSGHFEGEENYGEEERERMKEFFADLHRHNADGLFYEFAMFEVENSGINKAKGCG